MKIFHDGNELYISYSFLRELGIPKRTLWKWADLESVITIKHGKNVLVKYLSIPAPTRAKLPSIDELIANVENKTNIGLAQTFANYLRANVKKAGKYTAGYMKSEGVNQDKATKYAVKRAIYEGLLDIHQSYCDGVRLKKGYLQPIAEAFREVAKCKTPDIEVSRNINNAKKYGIDYVILDSRKGKNSQKFGDDHIYMLATIVARSNNLNNKQAAKELIKVCKAQGVEAPSVSWGEKQAAVIEKNIEVYAAKFGLSKANKLMPFAKVINATYADDQYQIDGWTVPFFCKVYDDKGKSRIDRLVVIAVKDTHSGKIVGYSIGESENRYTLYEAIYNTYENTGALPYEIVTDNHSFNLTEIVENFKTNAEKLGMVWSVDCNPQRKAKVERGFKMLAENHLKQFHGYLGQGVLSKEKHGRVSQEVIMKYYTDKVLSMEEVKLYVASAILEFNDTPYEGLTLSPNQLYEQCIKPHRIELDVFCKVRLFTLCKEYKVSRGQITIESNGKKYEYQLKAEHFIKYNERKVTVRYESFDTIYLFDKKTDVAICSLKTKQGIHGAIANQTE